MHKFVKSSWSKNNPQTCVEVVIEPGKGVAVRDSKDPHSAALFFTHAEWEAFLNGAKAGEFDNV